jgi:hypothetical protein
LDGDSTREFTGAGNHLFLESITLSEALRVNNVIDPDPTVLPDWNGSGRIEQITAQARLYAFLFQ